jgi:hypothetical protein
LTEGFKRNDAGFCRYPVFFLNPGVDFVPMHFDVRRGFNSEPDLSAFNAEYNNTDIWSDGDAFSAASR